MLFKKKIPQNVEENRKNELFFFIFHEKNDIINHENK